jgi:hypothetical protein
MSKEDGSTVSKEDRSTVSNEDGSTVSKEDESTVSNEDEKEPLGFKNQKKREFAKKALEAYRGLRQSNIPIVNVNNTFLQRLNCFKAPKACL